MVLFYCQKIMKRHSKSSILFNKIDIALSRKLYGNTTGFLNNFRDQKKSFIQSRRNHKRY